MKILITAMAAMAETAGSVSRSFDEVLLLTGNLNYQYLKKSVENEEYNHMKNGQIIWENWFREENQWKELMFNRL